MPGGHTVTARPEPSRPLLWLLRAPARNAEQGDGGAGEQNGESFSHLHLLVGTELEGQKRPEN
jgi:hypothetical protein